MAGLQEAHRNYETLRNIFAEFNGEMRIQYRTKYGNVKQRVDGHVFDSKKEAQRYRLLCWRQAAGEITDLKVHPRYELQPSFRDRHGRLVRAINVTWDFYYHEHGVEVVEDVKSPPTRKETAYRIRVRLFKARYPDFDFKEA